MDAHSYGGQYYRITVDEWAGLWGDTCTFWFAIGPNGDAVRQLQYVPNEYVLSYDGTHPHDSYDGLQQMVVDGDETWWRSYEITAALFEAEWQTHVPVNRPAPVARTGRLLREDIRPRFPPQPMMVDEQTMPPF